MTADGAAQTLKAKETQLLMLQEDVAELQFCLRESQTREQVPTKRRSKENTTHLLNA